MIPVRDVSVDVFRLSPPSLAQLLLPNNPHQSCQESVYFHLPSFTFKLVAGNHAHPIKLGVESSDGSVFSGSWALGSVPLLLHKLSCFIYPPSPPGPQCLILQPWFDAFVTTLQLPFVLVFFRVQCCNHDFHAHHHRHCHPRYGTTHHLSSSGMETPARSSF